MPTDELVLTDAPYFVLLGASEDALVILSSEHVQRYRPDGEPLARPIFAFGYNASSDGRSHGARGTMLIFGVDATASGLRTIVGTYEDVNDTLIDDRGNPTSEAGPPPDWGGHRDFAFEAVFRVGRTASGRLILRWEDDYSAHRGLLDRIRAS